MHLWKIIITGFPLRSLRLRVLVSIAFKLLQSTVCQVIFGAVLPFRLSTLSGVAGFSTDVITPSSGQFSGAGVPEQAMISVSNNAVVDISKSFFFMLLSLIYDKDLNWKYFLGS